MSSNTANAKAARVHARAQNGTVVEAMPIVPAMAEDAPTAPIWEETIGRGGYTSRRIARGSRLRLIDLHGDACVSMLVFNAECPVERLNVADTAKVQWNAYLTANSILLSDMGRAMMSILSDDAASHDIFCGASNEASNHLRYGQGKNYSGSPNARDRFMLSVAKYGLGRKDVHPCINWFKGVKIGNAGETKLDAGPHVPGRALVLRAEMDLLVVLANCPHVLDVRDEYTVSAARVTAWGGEITPAGDEIRNSSPERLRAFENTEDYYSR